MVTYVGRSPGYRRNTSAHENGGQLSIITGMNFSGTRCDTLMNQNSISLVQMGSHNVGERLGRH